VFRHIIQNLTAFKFYRNDQTGIIERFLNEGENWNSHLNNSKAYIINALPKKQLESIAILGSGWLLDVPVDELLSVTQRLIFIDINHPKQILNKYKNHSNIEFRVIDLTNNLVEAFTRCKSFNDFKLALNNVSPLSFFQEFDYVVSLNLLNQLDILLCDLLKQKYRVPENNLFEVRELIQSKHLAALPKNKSCIITDFEEINYINTIDNIVGKSLIFISLEDINHRTDWLWTFDTQKTYRNKMNTTFRVLAGKY